MRHLLRPRLWIACLVSVAGGLLAWMLPPFPDWTARLPDGWFGLHVVSSNGRFLVTHGRAGDKSPHLVQVWDRQHGLHEPRFELPPWNGLVGPEVLLSPDETMLAAVCYSSGQAMDQPNQILLYDLASGELRKRWNTPGGYAPFFSREGKLLVGDNDLPEPGDGPDTRDQVVRDAETGVEVRRLPKQMGGFVFASNNGPLAVYRRRARDDGHTKIYSRLTGELVATHDLVGNFMGIRGMARDGQTVEAHGWSPGTGPWSMSDFDILVNTSGMQKTWTSPGELRHPVLSPDGEYLANFGRTKRHPWLAKWWPVKEGSESVYLYHWTTDTEVARFTHAHALHFSPQGNQVAILREDNAIDIYAWPLSTPWGLLFAATFVSFAASWSVGWLWSRRRLRVAPA